MNQPTSINDQLTPEPRTTTLRTVLLTISSALMHWIVIPVSIVLLLHNFVFQAFHVVGSSMIPTLHNSDYLIVSKVDKTFAHASNPKDTNSYLPHRNEIVVFRFRDDPSQVFVKRVIALPSEHVTVKDGSVTVFNSEHPNGFNPDLSGYSVASPTTEGSYDDVIPIGSVFVLGDNRAPGGSYDSRAWGTLPTHYIIGRVLIRLLPLDQWHYFSVLL